MADNKKQKHFVLVHGLCHGAWCWYKLKSQLESAGHRVTVLDLAASGINMKAIEDVHTFHEYTRPLLAFLASLNEQAILVGHSFGGMSLALAMDLFPHKISFGVFVTAFMPDTIHQPSYVLDKVLSKFVTLFYIFFCKVQTLYFYIYIFIIYYLLLMMKLLNFINYVYGFFPHARIIC